MRREIQQTMKAKKAFILLMLVLSAQFAQAQRTYTTKNGIEFPASEIGVSFGCLNLPEIAFTVGGAIGAAISMGYAEIEELNSSGCLAVEYLKYVSPSIAFGATATAERFAMKFKDDSEDDTTAIATFMPTVKASWFRREHVGMYSKVAAGAYLDMNDDDPGVGFAAQVSPIGVEVGGKNLRAFSELGFGFQSLLCAGIRFCF